MPGEHGQPRVVVTGAAGGIGSAITARLADRWQIRATDLHAGAGIEALDVTDPDRCRAVFSGAEAVVHLAANANPDAGWSELIAPNIEGVRVVAATARECAVPRLVLASSLQAVSAYPEMLQRRGADPPRPANLYGATKAWAEALGAWVAATSPTTVVALRIGYFSPQPPSGDEATPRNLSAWLSPADCAELVRAAVEAELSGFVVVNGVSANRHLIAELGDAKDRLGYQPRDDAWQCRRPV